MIPSAFSRVNWRLTVSMVRPRLSPISRRLIGKEKAQAPAVQPASVDQGVSNIKSRSALVTAPTPTRVSLGALDASKTASLGGGIGPRQVGTARDVVATRAAAQTQQQLQWKPTATGGKVAAISFSAEGAYGLRLGVVVKALPQGTVLRVYSQANASKVFQISGQEVLQRIERNAQASEFGNIVDLLKSQSLAMRTVDLDVLHEDNAKSYWGRDQTHDFAIQLNFDQATLPALATVLQKWINHFLGIATTITPLKEINDPKWVWHVGLDASATEILNALYNKERVDEATLSRIICLFKLDFNDPNAVVSQIRGKPIYLGMAMNADGLLKLKPQNVIFNLPLNPVS